MTDFPQFWFGSYPLSRDGDWIVLPVAGKRYRLTIEAARSLAKMLLRLSDEEAFEMLAKALQEKSGG